MKSKSDLFFFYAEKMGFLSSGELMNIFRLGMDMEEYLKQQKLSEDKVLKLKFIILKHLLMTVAFSEGFLTKQQVNHFLYQKLREVKECDPPFSLLSLDLKQIPPEYLKNTIEKWNEQGVFTKEDFLKLASTILMLSKNYQGIFNELKSPTLVKIKKIEKDGKIFDRYELTCKCGTHVIIELIEKATATLLCGKCQQVLIDIKPEDQSSANSYLLLENQPAKQQEREIPGYQRLQKIGDGTNGTAYATQNTKGMKCVVKVFDYHRKHIHVAIFFQEMKMLSKIDHPNILKVYDYGEHNNTVYYATEYLDGGTLLDLLSKAKSLPYQQAVKIIIFILNALIYAHENNLVHKDIRPANIFITKDGQIKLMELGIVKILEHSVGSSQSGQAIRTPYYIAPEQLSGIEEIQKQVDIYAIGAVLYHCVSGVPPFSEHESSTVRLLMNKIKGEYLEIQDRNPELPKQLFNIINKSMALKQENRYLSAIDMKQDLVTCYQLAKK